MSAGGRVRRPPAVREPPVVVTVTVNNAAAVADTLRLVGDGEQVAAGGAPLHVRVTLPAKPLGCTPKL